MCGIAAIFNYGTGEPIDQAELTAIRDYMAPRGPDGFGNWVCAPDRGSRIGLAHRRLSIIDLSPAGAQPMVSADGALVVTFNGEIYNYRELRAALEAKGHQFKSNSDTEVLLHLYKVEGERMLDRLRGMFAFIIWDNRQRKLFAARDPFGIKPLYLADNGKTIRLASQVKALLAGNRSQLDTSPAPAGHVGFFLWGHVPDPWTLYRGIKALPAGTWLSLTQGDSPKQQAYCSITNILSNAETLSRPSTLNSQPSTASTLSTLNHQLSTDLRTALLDTVRHHLIADVPVGIFLSSGLDSTTIAALAAASCRDLRTVTLAFEEFRDRPEDESPLAAEVAARIGSRHQTVWVRQSDFAENFERMLGAMDQPSCDGINSFFVSYAAKRAGLKVALSGLGGDELFGGYPSFRDVPRCVNLLRWFAPPSSDLRPSAFQRLGRGFRALSAPVLRRMTSPKYAGLLEYGGSWAGAYLLRRGMFMPWELPELLDADLARQGWDDLNTFSALHSTFCNLQSSFLKVGALELTNYMRSQLLRDTDWASMHHSIEVRTPLVDVRFLQNIAPLLAGPDRPTKREAALAAFGLVAPHPPSGGPPATGEGGVRGTAVNAVLPTLLDRPKTGFTIPVRDWLLRSQLSTLNPQPQPDRGLRGWSKLVYSHSPGACLENRNRKAVTKTAKVPASPHSLSKSRNENQETKIKVLVLLTDAFGGHGGIAKFNRDLLNALCSAPETDEVIALPRLMPDGPGQLPGKLTWLTTGLGGKLRYTRALLRAASQLGHPSTIHHPPSTIHHPARGLIWCAHINLLPLAWLASVRTRAPIILNLHGIEAWQPHRSPFVRALLPRVAGFVSVSRFTWDRFVAWNKPGSKPVFFLPNAIDVAAFTPGPRDPALEQRYGVTGRKVLLTLARLSAAERYKGIDELLELMPALQSKTPNLCYLICGDGDDRPRLVAKARCLGLSVADFPSGPERPLPGGEGTVRGVSDFAVSAFQHFHVSAFPSVVFAGRVPETEKVAHYRLADVFAMPGYGEGFGIVYLEAMACGVPVIASKADASREAVLNGELGLIVDPSKPDEIKAAILGALERVPVPGLLQTPAGLDYFSFPNFETRCHHILQATLNGRRSPRPQEGPAPGWNPGRSGPSRTQSTG